MPLPGKHKSDGKGHHGDVEAWLVKDAMDSLETHDIKVVYTPGNHDLDDDVTPSDIERYQRIWGDTYWSGFDKREEVFFISINSQLYFLPEENEDKPIEIFLKEERSKEESKRRNRMEPAKGEEKPIEKYLQEVRAKEELKRQNREIIARYRVSQTKWLEGELRKAQTDERIKAIVVLTHIPPFIGSQNEKHGWGNWDYDPGKEKGLRKKILDDIYQNAVSPELWLCGHFHGNVRTRTEIESKPIEIVTTGPIGASMLWHVDKKNVLDDPGKGEYSPTVASKIAEAKDGTTAFAEHILDGKWANEKVPGFRSKRIDTDNGFSGVRIVQFFTNGQYRHKWFNLQTFQNLRAVNDDSMKDAYISQKWFEPNYY